MGRIVQLSKNVINQIAAGEVIERPFSVVKELVENSIDAGATRISVEVANECRDLRVADNGAGIHPDDIILAFSKHATSKIKSGEDLFNIQTIGTEILGLTMEFAFGELKLHKVFSRIFADNPASIHSVSNNGFEQEDGELK